MGNDNLPPDVAAYFAAVDDKLNEFQSCSEVFDDLVKQQARLLVESFKEVIPRYLLLAHAYSTPAMTEMNSVFKVLGTKMQEISALANKNKGEDSYQALMALQSASEALNWVTVAPKPANAVSDAYDTCLYYANRVSKDKGEEGKKWVKAIGQLMTALKAYIVDYHSSGLLWKGSGKCPANHRDADLATLMSELDVSGGGKASSQAGAVSSGGSSDAAESYLQELKPLAEAFAAKSASLGDPVDQQCKLFVSLALSVIPKYLTLAENHKQPAQADFPAVYKELSDPMGEITKIADANFRHKQANFLTTVKTAAEVFNWIVVKMRPHDFVKETLESTMFYGNRAIKDAGAEEKAWLASLIQFFKKLQEFVKDFYSTGVIWKGSSPMALGGSTSAGGAPPPPPPGGAPPPPPPPAVDPDAAAAASSADEDGGRAALFAAINQGTDITRGLKKVTKDMQTHKNPELRGTSMVPAGDTSAAKPAAAAVAPKATKAEKPPRKELEFDRKWIVENFKEETVEIEISNLKHTVYLFNCKGTTVVVKNKVNSISIDNCSKCGVVFDNLLSSLDIVNSKSIQVQALGKMPLLNIDKTDGAQVYLSSECLDCEIVSAKSSEMNLLVPQDDGDFTEFAIPEQFITRYNLKTKKLKTECSESLG